MNAGTMRRCPSGSFDTVAGRQALEREAAAGAMAPVLTGRRAEPPALGRANRGRRRMLAGVGRTVLMGRRGIGAGHHHDRFRCAIEPLLQADRVVRAQDGLSANPGDCLREMNRTSA